MTAAAHEPGSSILRATRSLLEARRAQRGSPDFGDAGDARLLDAILAAPDADAAAAEARQAGALLGREVFARRVFEDSMPGCFIVLSTHLMRAGWGTLHVEEHFHRTAIARFAPAALLHAAPAAPLAGLVSGVLEGTFSEAFNCAASAERIGPLRFQVDLREGRDVNGGRS